MIDRGSLLTDLRRQLRLLERDLAERAEDVPEMATALEAEYRSARQAERTGHTFGAWRAGELTQAAVSWLLGCVFVRFTEDNGLVEAPLIGGPGRRRSRAEERQTSYFRGHPTDTDRDYLLDVFSEVAHLPAMAGLYDRTRNPVWRYGISGDAARDLLAFWRAVDPDTGALRHDFTDPDWDTRFLGDLYQDLSDDAKKRYALLQTPEFVEEFILDRTLTPALDEFGLADTRLIDPACGSGHFLLGAFHRLLRAWLVREPGTPERALIQRALDSVYGVDVNPFAAAIAHFRLLIAALRASRIEHLKDAPAFAIHVAAGDSLLHGRRFGELDIGIGAEHVADHEGCGHAFLAEDLDALNRVLGQQYHVVVGNPPYITVKDKAVNQLYRTRYMTCYRQYSLAVPFAERFFDLSLTASDSQSAGYVGLITANSFMKREFGKKLIESFLPTVDLTHVIDTSGAYIPGHGTPTVILFARCRTPVGDVVRLVMGTRGEPATPADPSLGHVWSAIVDQVDVANSESEWVSSDDAQRETLSSHPWSIGGGGASFLKEHLDRGRIGVLQDAIREIGFGAVTREDEVYLISGEVAKRIGIEPEFVKPTVAGEMIRDWTISAPIGALWPYDGVSLDACGSDAVVKFLWSYRCQLRVRVAYGRSQIERGLTWYEYSMFFRHRYRSQLSVTYAFVATHNHFVLDHGGKVFNRSAPVIKLPKNAREADHLSLVGLLNSSVACFWMKQMFHNKGSTIDTRGARQTTDPFENFYEFTGTGLKQFPLPPERPVGLAESLDRLATERQAHLPPQIACRFPLPAAELYAHRDAAAALLGRMIALQEELDWECYWLYGVSDANCGYRDAGGSRREPPPLALGERAFEIVMARQMATGELQTTWFARHGSTPVAESPAHWPADYRTLVERRIKLIESDRYIGLLEKPEYKRRWNVAPWHDQERRALRNWMLDRLESPAYWPDHRLVTVRTLADRAAVDARFQQVAARYAGDAGVDLARLVTELVENESVPALPMQRYKPSGLAKRADWETTWRNQRHEDAIDADVAATVHREDTDTDEKYASRVQAEQQRRKQKEIGSVAPPRKYRSADFLKASYWRLCGPLDVPKERFVSLPDMSRDSDPSLLIGWAGWDTPSLCQAVASYYTEVSEQDGWNASRLTPLLAVLQENLPWLNQWHNDIDPVYHQRLGDFYETFLRSQLSTLGLTVEDLRTWAPSNTARGRKRV